MADSLSFRRVVRASRLISERKCPGCEMDYKPQLTKLETELRDTKQKLALLFDSSCYSDSLGVEGSSFTVCRWCGGGSSPGKSDFTHNTECLFDDDALEQRVNGVWEEVPELESELRDLRALHAEIIEQGRKVQIAASGESKYGAMSAGEYIDWVLGKLEDK